jgi:hypothetical protein
MTTREFEKLAREHLLPLLPGFEVKKGLLFETPIGYLLRGLTFQPSQYDRDSLYLSVFVQALYVPEEVVLATHDERSPRFAATETEAMRAFVAGPGRGLLDQLRTPADLAECLESRERGHPPDPFPLEVLAYSQLLSGRRDEAERVLEVVESSGYELIQSDLDEGLYSDDEAHPLGTVLERMAQVREALSTSVEDAIALLERWREQTARNLSLSQHLAPPDPATRRLAAGNRRRGGGGARNG